MSPNFRRRGRKEEVGRGRPTYEEPPAGFVARNKPNSRRMRAYAERELVMGSLVVSTDE